jgi:predicted Zn-dependent protease with MMP-like domain
MRKILVLFVVLVVAAIAVPFFVPMSGFIPQVSALASEKLGHPVTINDLQLRVLPTPRLVAMGVAFGKKRGIRIHELQIVPDLLSFISGPVVISVVRAYSVDVEEIVLPRASKAGAKGFIAVREVQLKDVRLLRVPLRLPPINIDARLGQAYRIDSAVLEMDEGAIGVRIAPQGAMATHLSFEGDLYGGRVKGSAKVDWAKQWQVSGALALQSVDLAPLQQVRGKPVKLIGRVNADIVFSAHSKTPDLLLESASFEGPFEIFEGAYNGVDLSKAGDLTASRAAGDVTLFKELRGLLQVEGGNVRISGLCARSPNMVAGGHVEIAEDHRLSGKLSVSVASTGGFFGVPVTLSGTTADPGVSPTAGYTIGAVLGTLILPGIGTGLGASAANALEGTASCK